MVKDSVIVSVSMSKQEAEFLDSMQLSPSKLIQEKILEQKRVFDVVNQEKEYLLRNIHDMQSLNKDYTDFLEMNQMFDKFTQWRKDVVLEKR